MCVCMCVCACTLCVCVCVHLHIHISVCGVCVLLALLFHMIVYYFKDMHECICMFVLYYIIVFYYYYITVLHYVRCLEHTWICNVQVF